MFSEIMQALTNYQSVFAMFLTLYLIFRMEATISQMGQCNKDALQKLAENTEKNTEVLEKGLERNTRAVLLLLSEKGAALLQKFANGGRRSETVNKSEGGSDSPLSQ